MKTCTKCLKTLPTSSFHRDSRGFGDGLKSKCAVCRNALNVSYRSATGYTNSGAAKEWREKNKDHVKQYAREYNAANPEKSARRFGEWRAKNRDSRTAAQASCAARKMHAMPKWASQKKIADVYRAARQKTIETGRVCHVDHIVPLKSDLVCGLHWEGNLQVLFREENLSKSNLVWPDSP